MKKQFKRRRAATCKRHQCTCGPCQEYRRLNRLLAQWDSTRGTGVTSAMFGDAATKVMLLWSIPHVQDKNGRPVVERLAHKYHAPLPAQYWQKAGISCR